jgi:NhaA family Na+:H+ antiporter
MALFIAGQAFQDATLNAAKLGILAASVVSSVAGLTLLCMFPKRDQTLDADFH